MVKLLKLLSYNKIYINFKAFFAHIFTSGPN